VWYCREQEGANWAGFPLVRAAFGAWLLKHECWRVLATSIRRFGMGVPTVQAPAGATANQVQQAQQLASSMRVGDMSGVGLPAGFKFQLEGLTGGVPDALAFIQYLDGQIAKQALAGLMDLGTTHTGSRALGETFLDLFMLSLQATADEIATIATVGWPGMPGILSDLVGWNWGPDEPCPKIICSDLGSSYELTEDAINRLVQFGAIDPDRNLESWLRKRWGLPQRAKDAPSNIPPPSPKPVAPKPIPVNDGNAPGDSEPSGPSEVGGGTGGGEPGPPQPVTASGGLQAADLPTVLRRALSPVEAAAGFDPLTIRQEWQDARDALVASYKQQILGGLQDDLAEQVQASVETGQLGQLASLTVDTGHAAALIAGAMTGMARTAANRARAEAASQGVKIPAKTVTLPDGKLGQVAAARAGLLGAYWAQQASGKALQVSAAAPVVKPIRLPADVAEMVRTFLQSMSDASLTDQLGAALTAAQNAGRIAVMAAADESNGTAQYTASEIEDSNTCQPCMDEDQTVFGSLADAEAAYPSGGYIGCQGGMRCRGTVIAYWGGMSP
jgi:hypothetical protein